jgi:hypothetical protein
MRFLAAALFVNLVFDWLEYGTWRVTLRHTSRLDVAQFAVLWTTTTQQPRRCPVRRSTAPQVRVVVIAAESP